METTFKTFIFNVCLVFSILALAVFGFSSIKISADCFGCGMYMLPFYILVPIVIGFLGVVFSPPEYGKTILFPLSVGIFLSIAVPGIVDVAEKKTTQHLRVASNYVYQNQATLYLDPLTGEEITLGDAVAGFSGYFLFFLLPMGGSSIFFARRKFVRVLNDRYNGASARTRRFVYLFVILAGVVSIIGFMLFAVQRIALINHPSFSYSNLSRSTFSSSPLNVTAQNKNGNRKEVFQDAQGFYAVDFKVYNPFEAQGNFTLAVKSKLGWDAELVTDTVFLDSLESKVVTLKFRIPERVLGGTKEELRLLWENSDDRRESVADVIYITVGMRDR